MKISCYCGELIYDYESSPDKAHMVSEAVYWGLLEQVDDAIEKGGTSPAAREATVMKVRSLLSQARRSIWQCQHCSRLYVDAPDKELQCFEPRVPDAASGVLGPPRD